MQSIQIFVQRLSSGIKLVNNAERIYQSYFSVQNESPTTHFTLRYKWALFIVKNWSYDSIYSVKDMYMFFK